MTGYISCILLWCLLNAMTISDEECEIVEGYFSKSVEYGIASNNKIDRFSVAFVAGTGNNPLRLFSSHLNYFPKFLNFIPRNRLDAHVTTHILGPYNSVIFYSLKDLRLNRLDFSFRLNRAFSISAGLNKHFLTDLNTCSLVIGWSPIKSLTLYLTGGANRKTGALQKIDEKRKNYPISWDEVKSNDPVYGGFNLIPSVHMSVGFRLSLMNSKLNISAGFLLPYQHRHLNLNQIFYPLDNCRNLVSAKVEFNDRNNKLLSYLKLHFTYSNGCGEYTYLHTPIVTTGNKLVIPVNFVKFMNGYEYEESKYSHKELICYFFSTVKTINVLLKTKHQIGNSINVSNKIMYNNMFKLANVSFDTCKTYEDKNVIRKTTYNSITKDIYDRLWYYTCKVSYSIYRHRDFKIVVDSGVGCAWNNRVSSVIWHALGGIKYSPDLENTSITWSNTRMFKFIRDHTVNRIFANMEVSLGRNPWVHYRRGFSWPMHFVQHTKFRYSHIEVNESIEVSNTDHLNNFFPRIGIAIKQLNMHYIKSFFDTFVGYGNNVVTGDGVWGSGCRIKLNNHIEFLLGLEYPKISHVIEKHISMVNSSIYAYRDKGTGTFADTDVLFVEFYRDPKEIKLPIASCATKIIINKRTHIKLGGMLKYFRLNEYELYGRNLVDKDKYVTHVGCLLHGCVKVYWFSVKVNYQVGCGTYTIADKTNVLCDGVGVIPPNYYCDQNNKTVKLMRSMDFKVSMTPKISRRYKLLVDLVGFHSFCDFYINPFGGGRVANRLKNGAQSFVFANLGLEKNITPHLKFAAMIDGGLLWKNGGGNLSIFGIKARMTYDLVV